MLPPIWGAALLPTLWRATVIVEAVCRKAAGAPAAALHLEIKISRFPGIPNWAIHAVIATAVLSILILALAVTLSLGLD
jgi:hypothetical protein